MSLVESLQRVIETLVKLSAALAAFGYVAYRAHLSRLGLPAPALTVEQYLTELWGLIGAGLVPGALFCGTIAVGLVASWHWRDARVRDRSDAMVYGHMLVIMIGVLVITIGLAVLLAQTWGESDLLVGTLNRRLPTSRHELTLFAAIGVWLVASIAYREWRPQSSRARGQSSSAWERAANVCTGAMLVIGALVLAIAYGRALHSATYPIATIRTKEDSSNIRCGLLVLTTEHSFELWRGEHGVGAVLSVPVEGATLVVGPGRDIIALAQDAAQTQKSRPVCDTVAAVWTAR